MSESYNDYLYRKRKEAGLSRKEVSASLGVSKFLYHRFERGYSVPKEEVVAKIDALYGERFADYLVGESSYPAEIRGGEEGKIRAFLKKLYQKAWAKILSFVLPFVFLLSIPAVFITDHYCYSNLADDYSSTYLSIRRFVAENGHDYSDPLGNFHERMLSYSEVQTEYFLFTAIMAPVEEKNIDDMEFFFELRFAEDLEDVNPYFFKLEYQKNLRYRYTIVNSLTGEYSVETGIRTGEDSFADRQVKMHSLDPNAVAFDEDVADISNITAMGDAFLQFFLNDESAFGLFDEGHHIDSFYRDILTVKARGDGAIGAKEALRRVFAYIGTPLGILLAGLSILSFVFLREKEEVPVTSQTAEKPLPNNKRLPLLVGASALRLAGGIMLLVGSVYVLLSLANHFGMISFLFKNVNSELLLYLASGVFFFGVFLLYIIGLGDDFAHPNRLYLRTILFGIIALMISAVQTFFRMDMSGYQNAFVDTMLDYMPSNIFLSIFLFHICAMFLFAKPAFLKEKWVKYWRLGSLLPFLFTIGVFIADVIFRARTGKGIQNVSYFLGLDRFPYSLATYCFLFGNYYLRKKESKTYGEIYLRGDAYAFEKNLTLCVPALVFGLIELILSFLPGARALGFGASFSLLLVAVLMLFYRGYNDKNHLSALIVSNALYGAGIIITYSMAIFVVLFTLL